MILGLTGTNGSGKDTVADYLVERGFTYYSCSDIIRESVAKQGLESTRENLINEGNELRLTYGNNVLADQVAKKIEANNDENAVVVSVRNKHELNRLRELPSFKFIFVDAPVEERYERIKQRASERDKISFEEFKAKEDIEMQGTSEHVQQLGYCKDQADKIIINDSSLEGLYAKVEELLHG